MISEYRLFVFRAMWLGREKVNKNDHRLESDGSWGQPLNLVPF